MIEHLRSIHDGWTVDELLARRPFDIDDLGTSFWTLSRVARGTFHADREETVEFVRQAIADMQRRGAVPMRLFVQGDLRFLEEETAFGTEPAAIREAVISAWLARGGTEEAGGDYHFATPAMIAIYNEDAPMHAAWRAKQAEERRQKAAESGPNS